MGRRTGFLVLFALLAIAGVFLRDRVGLGPEPRSEPTAAREFGGPEPAPEPRILVIEVVDGETRAPVADAEVRSVVRSGSERSLRHERLGDYLPSFLSSVRTDEDGLVRIEMQEGTSVEVTASVPGRFAGGAFDAPLASEGERRERLVLTPDWDLTVEVVGDDGAPVAGIPVVLRSDTNGWKHERTDSRGRALFPHAGYEVTRDPLQQVRVGLGLPLAGLVETIVEREPPPDEPLRLRLPPFGSVEVLVLDEDGERVEDEVGVCLRPVRPGESREGSHLSRDEVHDRTSGGRALFEHVGLDLELVAELFGEPEHARTIVPAPRSRGERVTATLRPTSEPGTVLRFRAVDEKRRPVVSKLTVTTRFRSRVHCASLGTVQSTDGEGRFEVVLESLHDGEQRELEVTAHERWGGRVDLSRSYPTGSIDMGDVVLAPLPLIVEGRVVDAAGRPVADAIVMPESDGTESEERFFEMQRTDQTGAFSMHGHTKARLVRLRIHHEELAALPVEVPLGSTKVKVVAQETGELAGAVLVDPGVPAGLLQQELRNDSLAEPSELEPPSPEWSDGLWGEAWDPSLDRGDIGLLVRSDGSFQRDGLLPGTYTLAVRLDRDVLAEVHGITVAAGEVTRDPRARAIDLRGRLHLFTLDLVGPSAAIERTGALRYTEAETGGPERSLAFDDASRIQVLTPLARIDATLRVLGCRTERLADLGERTEVGIRRGFPVRLVLSPGFVLPARPLLVGVTLVSEPGDKAGVAEQLFDTRGELLFHVPEPGTKRVRWFVDHVHSSSGSSSSSRSHLEMPDEQVVVVEDRAEEQRVELTLSNERLKAALAR